MNGGPVSVLAPILQPRHHQHLPAPGLHHDATVLRRPLAAAERRDGPGAAELPVADRDEASVTPPQPPFVRRGDG